MIDKAALDMKLMLCRQQIDWWHSKLAVFVEAKNFPLIRHVMSEIGSVEYNITRLEKEAAAQEGAK